MIRAAKKDDNHHEVEKAFKDLGYITQDLSQLKNACDLLAVKGKRIFVVEIKDGKKPPSARKLTEGEEKFALKWGAHWALITSVNDVIELDRESAL